MPCGSYLVRWSLSLEVTALPQTPRLEHHFTRTEIIRDIAIGMADRDDRGLPNCPVELIGAAHAWPP